MTGAIRRWLWRQEFDPGIGGAFVNPFFLTRRALVTAMRQCAPDVTGRVLDVGCGQKPYLNLFTASQYVGLEIDTPASRARGHADHFYDGSRFPFADREFDTVVCNQVLEHVFNPDVFVGELQRVLRPNGTLVLTVPFVWDEHEQPYDYARYSSFGLRHLLEKHGLLVERQLKTCADVSMLFQLWNAYLFKILRSRSKYLNLLTTMTLMAPGSLAGLALRSVMPGNPDLYLDNIVIARRSA